MNALITIFTVLTVGLTSGARVELQEFPTDIAYGSSALWILESRRLLRIDPAASAVVTQIPVECATRAVAAQNGEVWVACQRNTLLRIDPSSNEITDTIRKKAQYLDLEAGGGKVWVLWTGGIAIWIAQAESLHLDEPTRFRVGGVSRALAKALTRPWRFGVLRKDGGRGPRMVDLAWTADNLWYMNSIKGWATRVDPHEGEVLDELISLPDGATRIISGTNTVWVVDRLDGAVHQYDPGSGELLATVAVGSEPTDGIFQDGALWITSPIEGGISRVDVDTHALETMNLDIQVVPLLLAPTGGDTLWTATVDDLIVELSTAQPDNELGGDGGCSR